MAGQGDSTGRERPGRVRGLEQASLIRLGLNTPFIFRYAPLWYDDARSEAS